MDSLVFRLWGKTNELDRRKEEAPWRMHPAICHMVDVGHVATSWIANAPSVRRSFARLSGLDEDVVLPLVSLITAMHDLGKVAPSFQAKSERGWEVGYGLAGVKRPADSEFRGFDHGLGTAILFREIFRTERRKDWLGWDDAVRVAAGHHGRIYQSGELRNFRLLHSSIVDLAKQTFLLLSALFHAPSEWPRVQLTRPFLTYLAGFVSVCDWFGSNSFHFPLTHDRVRSGADLWAYLRNLEEKKVGTRQLREAGLLDTPGCDEYSFEDLFAFEDLRPLQQTAVDLDFGREEGAELLIIEGPMGLGKTEIALYAVARAFTHLRASGMYFGLPTQASSNALLDRIIRFTDRIRVPDHPLSLALAHGSRQFDTRYRTLVENTKGLRREFERSYSDPAGLNTNEHPSEVIAPLWLQSSKRSLLARIGVGTIDQALLGQIQARHAFVRMFALADKVVVMDEIHAYDAYTGELIEGLLRWLRALGIKVILLSATLPRILRSKLVEAYGMTLPERDGDPWKDPYPILIHGGPGTREAKVHAPKPTDKPDKKTTVLLHDAPEEQRIDRGLEVVRKLSARGGCIVWLRNTVREAQEAYDAVVRMHESGEESPEIVLLHSRFTRTDRSAIEEDLLRKLGNGKAVVRPHRMIVIATQVIEQSIDLDFDSMISDIAPIDLLLQRAGRLWRHKRGATVRQNHTRAELHVLLPSREEMANLRCGPSGRIYAPDILARTAFLLRHHTVWELPDACRQLVSWLYDRDDDYWTADRLGVDGDRLAESVTKRTSREVGQADRASLISMVSPDGITGTFGMHQGIRDEEGVTLQLATRDGDRGVTIILLKELEGVLCFAGSGTPLVPLPDPDDDERKMSFDEGVVTSSVSFTLHTDPTWESQNDRIAAISAWWTERRPWDRSIFVQIEEDGTFEFGEYSGSYSATRGLSVAKHSEVTE